MNKVKSPCLNCTNREIGCHKKCELYLDYCAKNDKIKAAIRNNSMYYEYISKRKEGEKWKKRKKL